ncbi:hypothetical protein C8R44DRAFT_774184 [Mycena epipterygia]|nr:hypothetical protein C8R44DRAFT_774184 [Mycena epipterygia]
MSDAASEDQRDVPQIPKFLRLILDQEQLFTRSLATQFVDIEVLTATISAFSECLQRGHSRVNDGAFHYDFKRVASAITVGVNSLRPDSKANEFSDEVCAEINPNIVSPPSSIWAVKVLRSLQRIQANLRYPSTRTSDIRPS